MSKEANPFTPGSKRHDLAGRMLRGDSSDKIIKDLKLKDMKPIYQLRTAWKKIRAKAAAKGEKKPPINPGENLGLGETPPGLPKTSPGVTQIPQVPGRIGAEGGTTVQIQGFAPGKNVNLTANNILMFQWFVAKYGYTGDISDFINDAIEDFFKSRNWKVMIVKGDQFI